MSRNIITINDNEVRIPHKVKMRDFEIANLLGITYSAVRAKIKVLLKSGQYEYCGCGGEIMRNGQVTQEYFGFDMVIAIAFQVDSYNANLFRKWVMRKMMQGDSQSIYIGLNDIRDSISS